MPNERLDNAIMQLQALLSERQYSPEQIAETAMHALFPTLSSGAANTYHRLGRGAILMDLRDLVEGKLNTTYVPESMLLRLNQEADLFEQAVAAVADYDPAREFVSIVWQDVLITIYRMPLA